jgi:hypothetical protein
MYPPEVAAATLTLLCLPNANIMVYSPEMATYQYYHPSEVTPHDDGNPIRRR